MMWGCDFIDNQILDQVGMTEGFDDVRLAEEPGISRVELLARLKGLMERGLLTRKGEGFFLTGQGAEEWVPLAMVHSVSGALDSGERNFEWDSLYIPEAGWDGD